MGKHRLGCETSPLWHGTLEDRCVPLLSLLPSLPSSHSLSPSFFVYLGRILCHSPMFPVPTISVPRGVEGDWWTEGCRRTQTMAAQHTGDPPPNPPLSPLPCSILAIPAGTCTKFSCDNSWHPYGQGFISCSGTYTCRYLHLHVVIILSRASYPQKRELDENLRLIDTLYGHGSSLMQRWAWVCRMYCALFIVMCLLLGNMVSPILCVTWWWVVESCLKG